MKNKGFIFMFLEILKLNKITIDYSMFKKMLEKKN